MAGQAIPTRALSEGEAWFTAAEIADLALPGLPHDKRSVNRRAREERWASRQAADGALLVRKRGGRGGGSEFHISLFPGEARLELARRGIVRERPAPVEDATAARWAWFDAQKASVKTKARERLATVETVETLCAAGSTQTAAVAAASAEHGIGKSTILGWIKLVRGLERANWLPALAPQFKGGGEKSAIPEELWLAYKSDALRLSAPTLTSVYDRVAAMAEEKGLSIPAERTFRRRLKAEVPPEVWVLKREGEEALRRSVPQNRRSVAHLHALEWVNIDGHKFDVFVRRADGKIVRPIMVAIQDVYSRKMLAWRIGCEESAIQTRLAFADLFRNHGIPHHCVLDNGRAFASKWISGGAKSRFRFKIKPEEPTGLLKGLGIQIHWALPYRGQSKPIERGFRDLCDRVAKHPKCEGAYTGNSPMAKPENYGTKAVEWDEFVALVDQGMAAHNARSGRRTETAKGRSFDEAFAESYATSRIAKATEEQLRFALLAAENKVINRQTGQIDIHGNRYWARELSNIRGDQVTVRFDPDNLHSAIHVYDLEGRYIVEAPLLIDSGFADSAGAREAAKREANYRKTAKEMAEAEELLSAEALADLQAGVKPAAKPEAGVVKPVRHADAEAHRNHKKPAADNASALDRMRAGIVKRAANNF
ncbi:MAG: transposase domain-containing protein [Pseudomonadota bacterium]